jgi:hypothetical protein
MYTSLHIECINERIIGHCWRAYDVVITSCQRLTKETIRGLFDMGFVGPGQELFITSACDDTEPCIKTNSGVNLYEYKCVTRCDSSG